MQDLYGPITAGTIAMLVALLVQFVKTNWADLQGRVVQLIALGFAALFTIPFHLFGAGAITALVVYEAVIYSLFVWLSSIGIYEVASKFAVKRDVSG